MLYWYATSLGVDAASVYATDDQIDIQFRSSVTRSGLRVKLGLSDVARFSSAMVSFGEAQLESTGRCNLVDLVQVSIALGLTIPEAISQALRDSYSFRIFVPSQKLRSLLQCRVMVYAHPDANLLTNLDIARVSGPLESRRLFNQFVTPN